MTLGNALSAVDLLYANLGALPDEEFGHISLLPFSVDGDEVNALKRKVCEAIVKVFTDAGYPMELSTERIVADANRQIVVACRLCSAPLLTAVVDETGHVAVPAASLLEGLSQRARECPHPVQTLEDHRRKIEATISESQFEL